jgi:hypothetical protein
MMQRNAFFCAGGMLLRTSVSPTSSEISSPAAQLQARKAYHERMTYDLDSIECVETHAMTARDECFDRYLSNLPIWTSHRQCATGIIPRCSGLLDGSLKSSTVADRYHIYLESITWFNSIRHSSADKASAQAPHTVQISLCWKVTVNGLLLQGNTATVQNFGKG